MVGVDIVGGAVGVADVGCWGRCGVGIGVGVVGAGVSVVGAGGGVGVGAAWCWRVFGVS